MRTIIVEDEIDAQMILLKYLEINFPDIEVCAIKNNYADAIEAIELLNPDFIFLDINLGSKSGIELASQLKDPKPYIIFTTAHSEFAIEALRMKAMDYILKPLMKSEFVTAVNRVINEINESQQWRKKADNQRANTKISVSTNEGKHIIDLEDILYIEASGAYCSIHFKDDRKKMMISKPLNFFCKQLMDISHFFRCHKSYLINIEQVEMIKTNTKTEIVLKDKTILPVSRNKKKDLQIIIQK